ncbi:hypothetical protein HCU01_04710 [Halomonas cupida]|uniref:DUF6984 domain-containing protein n=1 Tax=Halomonas cupida TaxID=44933 RepID=A0ABQ0WC80_9GAMM|nr:hypothetical protein HCU01_04710 [Halomonas cupida]
MRKIEPAEEKLIAFLTRVGDVQLSLPAKQLVWVVNQEMRSIRADYCPVGCRVRSVASYEFEDDDGVPIIATLFLTDDGRFGELDFWKVNDEPVLRLPSISP